MGSSALEPYGVSGLNPFGLLSRETRAVNNEVARCRIAITARRQVTEAKMDAVTDATHTGMHCASHMLHSARAMAGNDPVLLRIAAEFTDEHMGTLRRLVEKFARDL
jgi:hypothetical protein